MNPKTLLQNAKTSLAGFDSGNLIQQQINFAGTPNELSGDDGIKENAVCFRYGNGSFEDLVGNKPSLWRPDLELLLYVETAGGKRSRIFGYDQLLDMFYLCINWSEEVVGSEIDNDLSRIYILSHSRIEDGSKMFYAITLTFTLEVCL